MFYSLNFLENMSYELKLSLRVVLSDEQMRIGHIGLGHFQNVRRFSNVAIILYSSPAIAIRQFVLKW